LSGISKKTRQTLESMNSILKMHLEFLGYHSVFPWMNGKIMERIDGLGADYEQKMAAALRIYAEAHKV